MATKTDFLDSGAQRKTRYDALSVALPGHQCRLNATGLLLLNVVAWQSAGSCSGIAGGLAKASALVFESRSCTSRRSVASWGTQSGIHPLFTMSASMACCWVSNELSITRLQALSIVQTASARVLLIPFLATAVTLVFMLAWAAIELSGQRVEQAIAVRIAHRPALSERGHANGFGPAAGAVLPGLRAIGLGFHVDALQARALQPGQRHRREVQHVVLYPVGRHCRAGRQRVGRAVLGEQEIGRAHV